LADPEWKILTPCLMLQRPMHHRVFRELREPAEIGTDENSAPYVKSTGQQRFWLPHATNFTSQQ
jgi:hypothetical protein